MRHLRLHNGQHRLRCDNTSRTLDRGIDRIARKRERTPIERLHQEAGGTHKVLALRYTRIDNLSWNREPVDRRLPTNRRISLQAIPQLICLRPTSLVQFTLHASTPAADINYLGRHADDVVRWPRNTETFADL